MTLCVAFPSRYIIVIDIKLPKKALNNVVTCKFCLSFVVTHAPLLLSNFDKGWRGDHKHKIMDRPSMPKYGTVSQVLLQLVVAWYLFLLRDT